MPLEPWLAVTLLMATIGALTGETAKAGSVPDGHHQVWSDEFTSLSLRTGGPTYDGLEAGTGTWAAAPGAWWNTNPKGVAGYGFYDWLVDPSDHGSACRLLEPRATCHHPGRTTHPSRSADTGDGSTAAIGRTGPCAVDDGQNTAIMACISNRRSILKLARRCRLR